MSLAAGTKLGPYEIVGAIGAGGMGEVYRARDSRLGREVAIKVLPESFARDADRLRRFEQEARTIAALNHPNILAVHDIGEVGGSPYIVCELLEGETLRDKMSEGPLPQRRAVEFASQIAEGLAAAHDKGVIHRDLKPENVFVTRDGRIKVLDFGLAKLAVVQAAAASDGGALEATALGATKTTPGLVMGTAGYMSPEQVRGKDVDQRTDIFALGAMMYEMLSGQRAFRGDTSVETMNAILKEDPPELETEKLRVSPGLERVVRRCLEKAPEQRFHSARDVGFALEALSGTSASTQNRAIAKLDSRRGLRIAMGLVALLLVAALAFYMGSRTSATATAIENQFQLLTFRPQIIFRAAFAPDGKTIVFSSAHWANRPDIFILTPEYPEPRATDLKNTQLLGVSSKGDMAVLTNPKFLGHRLFRGTLAKVPIGGSAPRAMQDDVLEADWSPDGSDLAITRLAGSNGKFTLEYPPGKILAETTGYFSDLRFSPKGDRIAFVDHALRYDDRGTIATVDLAGNKKLLTPVYWGVEGLAWTTDGKEVLYSAGSGSYSSFPVRGVTLDGKLRIVQDGAGGAWIHDVSRDGRWVVTQEQQWREMAGVGAGAKTEVDLSFLDFSSPVAISAGGKTLLFTEENSFFGDHYSACIRKMDGSPAVTIGEGQAQDLSPDGTQALAIVLTAPDKLMMYPIGSGAPRQISTGKLRYLEMARWFPDGKRILVCGSEDGRMSRCYVLGRDGGNLQPVTPAGVAEGFPSPDGNEVAGLDPSGNHVFYAVNGGGERRVPTLGPEDTVLGWTMDGKGALVRKQENEATTLVERVDLQSGKRTLLRRLTPPQATGLLGIQAIAIAEDAKYYAYAYRRQQSAMFMVQRPK